MEPESSSPPPPPPPPPPPNLMPEQDRVPLPSEGPEHRVTMDPESVRLMSKVTETALGLLDFWRQFKEYEKDMELVEESVRKQVMELQKIEKDYDLKHEEIKRELQLRKEELEARQTELKERSTELEKREEQFQLKQDREAREIEVKRNALELKEKKLEERVEKENGKRSRDEVEHSLLSEKDRDDDSLIHSGKKHKPIRAHDHDDNEKETDSDCGKTSSATASQAKGTEVYESVCIDVGSDPAYATASQAMGREVNEVVCIDDEDPKPYSCPDSDFNDFNSTKSSFAVGQVWALYDPLDHMPRFYAQIKRITKGQLSVRVAWLESKHTTKMEKPIPIACGAFKYGGKSTNSHLMFSHEMHFIKSSRSVIIINPRKGETWALFRDWTTTWNSHKRPCRYDFVQIVSELDSDHGIGVAYLERVEGFTSVYKLAEQHGILELMIPSEEMLRFSHRVPSFRLTGDERIGVPAGSFELDPAAIPRDCLEASNVKEEEN